MSDPLLLVGRVPSPGALIVAPVQQRMQALVAFTLPARSRPWRRHVLHRFGVVANGLEPRDPRRQLEQLERQRQELPVSEPQQQQPGQPTPPASSEPFYRTYWT